MWEYGPVSPEYHLSVPGRQASVGRVRAAQGRGWEGEVAGALQGLRQLKARTEVGAVAGVGQGHGLGRGSAGAGLRKGMCSSMTGQVQGQG